MPSVFFCTAGPPTAFQGSSNPMHQSACAWPLFAEARQSAFVMWFSSNTGVFEPVVAYENTVFAKIAFCPAHTRPGSSPDVSSLAPSVPAAFSV